MRITRGIGLAAISLFLIGGVAIAGSFVLRQNGTVPEDLRGIALTKPLPIDRQDFFSSNGETVFPIPSRNKWTFLVVGYAHCPDVCPFILGNLAEIEAHMTESLPQARLPRFVFLSVDPKRDTPEFLKDYVQHFSERLVGVTGSTAAIDRLTQQIGAFYRLGEADADGFYPVDHSAEVFLIDPSGRLFGKFEPPLDAEMTTARFRSAIDFYQASQL